MSTNEFNSNSTDALFARLLQRMDDQDRMLLDIKEQCIKTNGRVTSLEHSKWYDRGFAGAIGVIAGGIWEIFRR